MTKKSQTPEHDVTEPVEPIAEEQSVENPVDSDSNEQEIEDSAEQRIAELEMALAQTQAKLEAQADGVLRAKAEAENVRRRAQQDVEKAHKFALEKFASELLPVIDNMERAIDAADPSNEAIKPVVEGVELTLKTFVASVEKFGLAVIAPQGQPFDPEKHQAIGMQESADVPANHVMAVLQKGYELNGRVIRPAMVMVAKAQAEPSASVDTQV